MREARFMMRVWDLPIRLFHWLLPVLVAASYATVYWERIGLHRWAGYAMAILLLFRFAWGFVGSDTVRFSRFLGSPLAGLRHLGRLGVREPDNEIGHNAAGGWMVLVMLGLLTTQVGLGFFARNRHGEVGPAAYLIDPGLPRRVLHWHHINFYLLLGAISLHVLTIAAHAVLKKQNLTLPMITGKRRLPGQYRAPRLTSPVLALALLALSATVIWVLVSRLTVQAV